MRLTLYTMTASLQARDVDRFKKAFQNRPASARRQIKEQASEVKA